MPIKKKIFQTTSVFHFSAATIAALITFLIYLPVLQNGFVNWDDDLYVYENDNLKLIKCFTPVAGLWHPLTVVSLTVDYNIWGLNPFGFHLTNIVFHTINTTLVYVLVNQLVSSKIAPGSAKAYIAGFAASLLYGIHPIHVESVAWVSERKDVLSAFFFLLALIAYLRYVSSAKKLYYTVCLISFTLSLMSKPMAISFPIVLLLLDYYPLNHLLRNGKANKRVVIEKLPFFILSIASSLVTIWAHYSIGALKGLVSYPFTTRIFVAAWGYIFYLVKILMPFNLAPLYPHPVKINLFASFGYFVPGTLLLVITLFCFISLKKEKLFLTVWFYYLITLLPVIGIIPAGGQAAADRYAYLPSLGLFLFAGLGVGVLLGKFTRRERVVTNLVFIIMFVLFGIRTTDQIAVWKDSITLWSHQIKLFPNTLTAYNNRGMAYIGLKKYTEAIQDFNAALELNPQDADVYNNRGAAYYQLGDYQQAIRDYSKAVKFNQRFQGAYYNLGLTYMLIGDRKQALINFEKAAKLGSEQARALLGKYYDNPL